jgi:hypothetical protein
MAPRATTTIGMMTKASHSNSFILKPSDRDLCEAMQDDQRDKPQQGANNRGTDM